MTQEEYIAEKAKELSMNIDEFEIGQQLVDEKGASCLITNKTTNSIEVFLTRTSKNGVDCKQWFSMRDFNRRFKK